MPTAKSFICMSCDAELPTLEALHEHEKGHTTVSAPPVAPETAPEPVKATDAPWRKAAEENKKKGVDLLYRYEGFCPDCGGDVTTILLDGVLKDTTRCIVLAWCPSCKKKIKQRSVATL